MELTLFVISLVVFILTVIATQYIHKLGLAVCCANTHFVNHIRCLMKIFNLVELHTWAQLFTRPGVVGNPINAYDSGEQIFHLLITLSISQNYHQWIFIDSKAGKFYVEYTHTPLLYIQWQNTPQDSCKVDLSYLLLSINPKQYIISQFMNGLLSIGTIYLTNQVQPGLSYKPPP